MGETEPKKRKPRKDKGKKRGKRMAKPRFQTGSIDFRTIGTQQTLNPTLLAGLLSSSRAIIPYAPTQQTNEEKEKEKKKTMEDIQKMISTELVKYAPRDLPNQTPTSQESFVPPPAQKPDTEQAQEERVGTYEKKRERDIIRVQSEKVRKAREQLEETEDNLDLNREYINDLEEELTSVKKREAGIMDRVVEIEGQRAYFENKAQQYERELEDLRQSSTGLAGQLGREIQEKEEQLTQTRAELSTIKQRMESDISQGLRARDEQLKQAEILTAEMRGKMMGLEGELESNKKTLEDYKIQMKESVPKREYDAKIKEFNKTIREQEGKIQSYKEQEKKSNALISQQALQKAELSSALSISKDFGQQLENLRIREKQQTESIEQERDRFEEERQSLKSKIVEAQAQRDLIAQFAEQQEEEFNEEARTSNEIFGMMTEELISLRNREQEQKYGFTETPKILTSTKGYVEEGKIGKVVAQELKKKPKYEDPLFFKNPSEFKQASVFNPEQLASVEPPQQINKPKSPRQPIYLGQTLGYSKNPIQSALVPTQEFQRGQEEDPGYYSEPYYYSDDTYGGHPNIGD